MHKSFKLFLPLLVLGMTAGAVAQTPAPPAQLKHYKTEFIVREVDAAEHVVNSRSFSTILATNNDGAPDQIRSGDKVPLRVGLNEKGDANIQYIDIGVNIDCHRVQELDGKLAMAIKAEVSSIPAGADLNSGLDPLIRQFQWNSDVVVTPGVPTVIFSSDDVRSKTKMQVEVNATLLK